MKTHGATTEGKVRSKYARRTAAFAIGITAVIVLAACGSSGSSKATVSPGAQPAASAASSKADVNAATTAKLGTVLVDSRGMTLYTLEKNGAPVACTGACASAWPPLVLSGSASTPSSATGVTGLSTMTSADGTQVTENAAALYRFKGDQAPGDTNGDGLASFGGVWHVVKSTAAPVSAPAPAAPVPTTPTTSSSSGGYGY